MPSFIIYGADKQNRERFAQQLFFEREVDEKANLIRVGEGEEKIGIKEIKELIPHLFIRRQEKQRGVLILEAQRLTTQAQNALLKILEEPPEHLVIVLTTPHPRLLLPTVVSRCLLLQTRKVCRRETHRDGGIEEIFDSKPGKRLAFFEEKYGYDHESIFAFLDAAESRLSERLTPENSQRLIKLWKAKKLLREETANAKLILDELLISW